MEIPASMLVLLPLLVLGCAADTEDQLLSNINDYRRSIGAATLARSRGADCLAEKLADQFHDKPCNNVTEAETSPGLEPNFPNYPQMLSDCKLNLVNTTGGQILVDCIPSALVSSAAAIATQNFTRSQEYQKYINSTDYTSAGVGSEDLWFVLVLGTNASDANYAQVSRAAKMTRSNRVSCFVTTVFMFSTAVLAMAM